MLWKCCTQYASKFRKLSSGHRKRSVFIPIPKKGNAKECSNYCTIALISHASKVMLKILQARLQQYVNHELPDDQADFRKGRGTTDRFAHTWWIIKKARNSRKTPTSSLLNRPKHLTVWITIKCGKFWEMGIPDHLTCLLRNLYVGQEATVRTGHGTADWFQTGKEYVKAVYCHPAYLTYMLCTSWRRWAGGSKGWNQDCWEKYQKPQICRWHHLIAELEEE